MDYLLFTLMAPLASFGDVAVGERRPSFERPGRSAVMGLVAAALGITRDRGDELVALNAGYGLAVLSRQDGTQLEDFHTTLVPTFRKGVTAATRAEEVALGAHEKPVLSWRGYRMDSWHEVALWARQDSPYPLVELKHALERPVFTLYVGRKSCPLGLPPWPQLVEDMDDLTAAFRWYDLEGGHARRQMGLVVKAGHTLHADPDAALGPGFTLQRQVQRRDVPLDRQRWQFGLRTEIVAVRSERHP